MSDNKALWERVKVTDPRAVKPITGKQYSGNSPKPYWIVERLTDEFGPCGIGWGFTIVSERFERFGVGTPNEESLHVAVVRLWYIMQDSSLPAHLKAMAPSTRGELEQVGQTRASYTTAKGKFLVDEDAPKKSVTDALVKCASYLGFAGDIFSGMWDDSKYVAWADEEWGRRLAPEVPAKPDPLKTATAIKATDGCWDRVPADEHDFLKEAAAWIKGVDAAAAVDYIASQNFDADQYICVWDLLPSNVRSAIKREQDARANRPATTSRQKAAA